MKKLFVLALGIVALTSCTENTRARRWGGTEEISLKRNEVVLNVTWKENEMWICTEDTISGVVYFREKSSWGGNGRNGYFKIILKKFL